MKHFAVLGDPVSHSLSPQLHTCFAQSLGIKLSYKAIQVKKTEIHQKLNDLQAQGYTGVNITAPLKELAYNLMSECSPEATQAKSINTIVFKSNNHMYGDNTDGSGLIHDLQTNLNFPLSGKKILILGAGGSTRGILGPLLKQQPNQVFIANRTLEKATTFAAEFGSEMLIQSLSLNQINEISTDVDLVLNTIPSNVAWTTPISNLQKYTLCYDLNYTSNRTPFLDWGQRSGSVTMMTGIGMLIEQARLGFKLWHEKLPTDSVKELKSRLSWI